MPDYRNQGRPDGRRPYGPKRPAGNFRPRTERSFGPRELFDAECASCHQLTQVPFRPNGKKPVYCKDCFQQDDSRSERRPAPPRPGFERRPAPPAPPRDGRPDEILRQLDALNEQVAKLAAQVAKLAKSADLGPEVRALMPEKPAAKKAAPKKAPAKAAKKAAKKK